MVSGMSGIAFSLRNQVHSMKMQLIPQGKCTLDAQVTDVASRAFAQVRLFC